jgi:hypothetical protein
MFEESAKINIKFASKKKKKKKLRIKEENKKKSIKKHLHDFENDTNVFAFLWIETGLKNKRIGVK